MSRKAEAPALLPLREQLALDRTELANERTWLATARTAIALFVTGCSFLQFFDAGWAWSAGWAFVVLSLPVSTVGFWRYRAEHRKLTTLADDARRRLLDGTS